ncbi:PAQR family membrane homeostasis protein TrhA [Paludisphaera soli]|uniref:PAQR family membrane homeostasis protein TrhA n=1 Tax=Paludisphaera soli TaxID=2712865 RepID=UPI0013ED6321|nr:hemolysin III family protein [Paludisphaera soli]
MPAFALRDPISTWTHLLGLAAALPTTWLLIRKALGTPAYTPAERSFRDGKAASLAVFGFGMAVCYAASAAYHGPPATEFTIELLRRLDLVGIFLLIAGTFTPAAWALMRPMPRRIAMVLVWGVSIACGTTIALGRPFPTWLATSIYLGLGWGMAICYVDIRRRHSARTLRMLPVGGALYSVGAVVNLTRAPEIVPGLGSHEVFHLFVLAGTAAHVAFLFRVVAPATPPDPDFRDRERVSIRRTVSAEA